MGEGKRIVGARRHHCPGLPLHGTNPGAVPLNAVYATSHGDEIGNLEPGKQAGILILNTADYRQLGYRYGTNLVRTVIKKGKIAFQPFS